MVINELANLNCVKCVAYKKRGFPLAEERKKQKTFFSLTAGSMGLSVRGVYRSRGISEFSCFRCLPPLPVLHHPPTLHVFFGLEVFKQCFSSSYSCMLIYCTQAQFQLFCQLSFGAVTLMIRSVDIIKVGLHGRLGVAPSCVRELLPQRSFV